MKLLEKDVQRQIMNWLGWNKIFCYRQNTGGFKRDGHFYKFGSVGAPDIIAIIGGKYIGIEIKGANGGKQSENQKKFQRELEAAGGEYLLVHSLDDTIKKVGKIIKKLKIIKL